MYCNGCGRFWEECSCDAARTGEGKGLYYVKPNWCRCHPETCCCDDWAVYAPDGERFSTHFREEDANLEAASLNAGRTGATRGGDNG